MAAVLSVDHFRRFVRPLAQCLSERRYYRIVARFHTARMAYGTLRGHVDRLAPRWSSPDREAGTKRVVQVDQASTAPYVDALRREGICRGIRLPPDAVREIIDYATVRPCIRPGDDEPFLISTLRSGPAADGQRIAVADVVAPDECPAIAELTQDSWLRDIATQYLGFRPARVEPRLYWSPASPMGDDERRALGQTIDFHYDIDAFHSLYLYFYLTMVERANGAHVVISGSHRYKPLSLTLSPSFQPIARIRQWYGRHEETVLEGGPGFGFFEDPACFHRALVPRTNDRLMLQFRYS